MVGASDLFGLLFGELVDAERGRARDDRDIEAGAVQVRDACLGTIGGRVDLERALGLEDEAGIAEQGRRTAPGQRLQE